MHVKVMDAVDMVFEEEKRHLFQVGAAKGGKDLFIFTPKLIQIALENRLCMFRFALKDLMCLICTPLAPL